MTADEQVTPAAAAQNCVGIALATVADTKPCIVLTKGRVKVKAGVAISRGQAVYGADASKRIIALADQTVNEGGAGTYTIYYNRKLGAAAPPLSYEANCYFFAKGKNTLVVVCR